MKNVEIRIGLE